MLDQEKSYQLAREIYAENGVDVEAAMRKLAEIPISIHAWQGDDVTGFEGTQSALTGGCQVTGNYPGRARNADELRDDLDVALSLIPGKHKVNLQAHQVDRMLPGVDRDGFTIENFSTWLAWAGERKLGLDIAPVFYSHPKLDHGYSLSHPDPAIRRFWIDHGVAVRKIAAQFGKTLHTPSIVNFWMPDGSKDQVADRYHPRMRMIESLDRCFEEELPAEWVRDAVESKLFGIGTESYTVTSNEFCLAYAAKRNKMVCLDMGHFHPTETVSDKLSAILAQLPELMLHVSRGVRWDSDHVLTLNEDLAAVARESVAYGYADRIHFALDYFDASINRVGAWVIGARAFQKALLIALLEPTATIADQEKAWDFTGRFAALEAAKNLPWGLVWAEFCRRADMPGDAGFMQVIRQYEAAHQSNRI